MKIISTVWSSNQDHVDGFAPLSKLVTIYREQKQIKDDIYFLILDGWKFFQHLEQDLKNQNCYLINANQLKDHYQKKYDNLYQILFNKCGGGAEFLFNNLIRWLVMSDFAEGSDFLHTDCDLVLNVDTNTLAHSDSIYMHSTCFVYIKNSHELKDLYSQILDRLISDKTHFINHMKEICSDELWRWGQSHVYSIDQIHEEILFYWMLKFFKLNWNDNRHKFLYIPFMQALVPEYNICPEILRPHSNTYSFVKNQHYINDKPLAYMHYQQNMRMLLGLYKIQDMIGVPDKNKYCPEMIHFFTAINQVNNQEYHYLDNSATFRKSQYHKNSNIDLLILHMLEFITKNQIKISGNPSSWSTASVLPANLSTVLDFEYSGWGSILNKDFWFADNMFA